jgi:hypothetical protein
MARGGLGTVFTFSSSAFLTPGSSWEALTQMGNGLDGACEGDAIWVVGMMSFRKPAEGKGDGSGADRLLQTILWTLNTAEKPGAN